jgi:hypothetical protein
MAKRKIVPEVFELTAAIERLEQSYYISENREAAERVGDEAIIELVGTIIAINPAYKQHIGREIEMTIVRARSFNDHGPTPTADKPFLVSLNLRKGSCSLMAYLPGDAFWALPDMIASKAITHVMAGFGKPIRGSAELLSLYFAPLSKIQALP